MKPIHKDTNRIDKVNSLIQHELSFIVKEFTDDLSVLVTITKVETSKDMKWAKIWISILGGEKPTTSKNNIPTVTKKPGKKAKLLQTLDDIILDRLAKEIYNIQGELNKHFSTKIIPRIQFLLDTSPRYAQHINELIEKIQTENDMRD